MIIKLVQLISLKDVNLKVSSLRGPDAKLCEETFLPASLKRGLKRLLRC